MSKIIEETTLGELAFEAAKRGVSNITIITITPYHHHKAGYVAELTYKTGDRWLVGRGETIAQALDDAFCLLEARQSESFK